MRNKYSKEFEQEMLKIAPTKELMKLWRVAREKYGYYITKEQLRSYLSKRKIRYKDYNDKHITNKNSLPIGSEYVKPDGMTLIKVSNDKWIYKQRYIYEKEHNVKVDSKTMIIFLDGNRENFNIDNLMAVSTPEYNFVKNKKLTSNDMEFTKTALLSAKLFYINKRVFNSGN